MDKNSTTNQQEVLEFINRFYDQVGPDAYDMLHKLFRCGYCFYFAHILKLAFGRGRVCLAAPCAHIVWEDTDGTPYDIDGINDSEYEFLIPVEELGDGIQDFMHVPGKPAYCNADDVEAIMKKYRAEGQGR